MAKGSDGAGFVLNNETRHAIFDQFGNRAAIESDNRRAASHGFDHDQSERLRPVDRHDQREGAAQKLGLLRVGDLPDKFDMRFGEERLNHLLEIVVVDCVDFGGDLERQSAALGNMDRAINPLLWRNATQKSEIGGVRRHRPEQILGHPVINRADPIRFRRRPSLRV